jgi:hypothetical protein
MENIKLPARVKKAISILLAHSNRDMDYGWDGTYGGYDEEDQKAENEMEKEMHLTREAHAYIKMYLLE